MSSTRSRMTICLALAILCGWGLAGSQAYPREQAPKASPKTQAKLSAARDNLVAALRTGVTFWEERLKTLQRLGAKGFTAGDDLDHAHINLAIIRHDLAVAEDNLQVVAQQRLLLVELYRGQLERLKRLGGRGAAARAEVETAQRHLAWARFGAAQLEGKADAIVEKLQQVIQLSQSEWEALKKLHVQGVASDSEVTNAYSRLILARYLLAKEKRNQKEAIQQLRLAADLRQRAWKQVQRLPRRATTVFDEYLAQADLFQAQLRLASAEGKSETVVAQLRRLVGLHEKTLPHVVIRDWRTEEGKLGLRLELAWDRYRLADFQHQAALRDDRAFAELGR